MVHAPSVDVRELMTRDVLVLRPERTLEEAALAMTKRRVSGAPVVDPKGRILGILSEADILRKLQQIAEEDVARHYLSDGSHSLALFSLLASKQHRVVAQVYEKLRHATVEETMTRRVHTAEPSDTLEHVAALMIRHDVNRVPIVEDGRIVGILTRADFAKFVAGG